MKLDPGMHIGLHLVFFGKSGVTMYLLIVSVLNMDSLDFLILIPNLCFL
jgi:hypothetical protein